MNTDERNRQIVIANRLIEEVILDVLNGAQNRGEIPMSVDAISRKLGMYMPANGIQAVMFYCKRLISTGRIEGLGPENWPDGFKIRV